MSITKQTHNGNPDRVVSTRPLGQPVEPVVRFTGHDRRTTMTFDIHVLRNNKWSVINDTPIPNLRTARQMMELVKDKFPSLRRRLVEVETKSTITTTVIAEDQ